MYLRSLELFGFKSFPSKTVLKFDAGITVIVGPNGCGKSNVFDAIKWALGEQSPKSLRGTKMEDVIFNGTESIPSLNYTEVTLVFSNEDNRLPIDYKEVAITRRLYRSGESQYFINRNPSRLKDIQDLFLSTGIGEHSYSFIEQGKVEMLLSYRPEEKRLIFDEASGIVKYKDKKKETLKKLRDTEDNILRLDDIILEVKRQMNYLERQVEKAKKYSKIQEHLIEVEKAIASAKTIDLNNKANLLLDEMDQLKEKEKSIEENISQKNRTKEIIENEIKEIRKKINEIGSQIVSFNSRIEGYHNHIKINTQRIEEIKERDVSLDSSEKELEERIILHQKRIGQEKESLSFLEKQSNILKIKLEDLKNLKEKRINQIKEVNKEIAQKKEFILEGESKKTTLNNNLIELETHIKNSLARKKRLTLNEARIDSYLDEHKEKLALLESFIQKLNEEFTILKEGKVRLHSELKEINILIENSEQKSLEIEKTLVELKSYFEFLKDLKIKYEEFPLKKKVTLVFDDDPKDINKLIASLRNVKFNRVEFKGSYRYEAEVEAKIISLPEEELEKRIGLLTKEWEYLKEIVRENKNKSNQLKGKIDKEEEIITEKNNNLREKLQEKENITEAVERFQEEKELIESELKDVQKEIDDIESKKNLINNEFSIMTEKLQDTLKSLEIAQNNVVIFKDEVNKFEVEIAKIETAIRANEEQKESIGAKLSLLEEEKVNIEKTISAIREEKRNLIDKKRNLEEEISILDKKIKEEREKIGFLSEEKSKKEGRLRDLEESFQRLGEELKIEEGVLEEVRNKIYNIKLEIQKIDFEKTKIVDYFNQVYNIDFVMEQDFALNKPLDVLEEEKKGLKKKIDSLGEVNLVAIEESKELNKRYEFLTHQREDLLSSKDSLKRAIQKINRISKEIFLEVFNKIEEEFKKYFRFLFGGGKAQLVLLDRDNVLESGVEIEVQPPGKKLQSVSLLSGGEKALTAIALIFSIFKVKPSPLCVLDEIDAPLDEANVDRFNQLLTEFAPVSQFIIITHNKKTMSKADVLYGVTMEERGISKLVSVRFAQEQATPVK